MPFKDGQEVLIKNPRPLVGIIVRERPGDRDELPENRHYIVRITDTEKLYLPRDLEPFEEPSSGQLKRYSPEWNAELTRWIEAGKRLVANNHDATALKDFSEAGSKIGFVVPISDGTKS
jgi:hypothetical protein